MRRARAKGLLLMLLLALAMEPAAASQLHAALGQEEYLDNKKKIVRYHFFRDDSGRGRDAVFGLDVPLTPESAQTFTTAHQLP